MGERPILFSAPMVRALLDGRNGSDIFKNASTFGATLAKIADATAGRTAIGALPFPEAASGAGQIVDVMTTAGNGFVLPAGGTADARGAIGRTPRRPVVRLTNRGIRDVSHLAQLILDLSSSPRS